MSVLPTELTSRQQWMQWFLTSNGGKRPSGKSNDPTTWSNYADIESCEKIAFVIDGNDPYTGVDLDGCIDGAGNISPWGQEILNRFAGVAYAEISPSGHGIKLLTRAKKPTGSRCLQQIGEGKTQIEAYDFARFWTITKNRLDGFSDIGDGQSAVNWLVDKYLKGKPRKTTNVRREPSGGNMPSSSLLQRAQAYTDAVPGGSVGDLRNSAFKLAGHLHSMVNASGERLSDSNVSHLLNTWNARCSTQLRDDELQEAAVNGRTNGSPPADKLPTVKVAESVVGSSENGVSLTDAKNIDPASAAAEFVNQNLSNGKSKIVFWSGGFLHWEKGKYVDLSNPEIRAKLVDSLNRKYSKVKASTVTDVMEQVRARVIISAQTQIPSWLDRHSWKPEDLVATENAIVHLPSFIDGVTEYSIQSTPSLFTTSALDYQFEKTKPDCPGWKAFLSQLWPEDPESINTLQEWFGYSLTPDTSLQKILMVIGPKRSGKGTIARVLRNVVGEGNVCGPTLSSLQTNFGLWPLIGKSVAIINDARLSGRSDQAIITERLLSISGEDAQTVDRKNMEPVTTKLTSRFTIISNELPRLQETSGALTGRMILLQMTHSFYNQEDRTLSEKLTNERAGILHWAIDGWKRLRERGRFTQPQSGLDLMDQMNELSSPILAFCEERCVIGPENQISIGDLYRVWCSWCADQGQQPTSTQTFGRDLRALHHGIQVSQPRVGPNRERVYKGISVINGLVPLANFNLARGGTRTNL